MGCILPGMPWSLPLMWAERAVDYTGSKMTIGAANKPIDVVHFMMAKHLDSAKYDEVKGQLSDYVDRQRKFIGSEPGWLMRMAEQAEKTGVGNCMEQSAIAYRYLVGSGRERGVAYVTISGPVNHAFVVLGLDDEPEDESVLFHGDPPDSWGPDAVVCDPWYHEWFAVATDWKAKFADICRRTQKQRLNTGSEIAVKCLAYR